MTNPRLNLKDIEAIPGQVDALVVGAGLSGMLTASTLLQQGRSVVMVDFNLQAGGRFSPENRGGFQFGAGFAFHDSALWQRLSERLSIPIEMKEVQNGGVLVHQAKGWTQAAEDKMPAWESHFAHPVAAVPAKGSVGVLDRLLEYCKACPGFQLVLGCSVTALEVEEGRVVRATLAGDKTVAVKDCYWAASSKGLLEVLAGPGAPEVGPARVAWLRRFVRNVSSPGVVLEFAHKDNVSEFTETLFLPFPSGDKEERRYLVGAFSGNRDHELMPHGKQLSSWILPLTEAEWGDNHETMKKIRSARRLLEKTFPNFTKSILFDRVLVLESTVTPAKSANAKKKEWNPLLPNLRAVADWAAPAGGHAEGVLALLLDGEIAGGAGNTSN